MVDSEEDEEEEADEDGKEGAVGGTRSKSSKKYICPDSSLKPSARMRLYDNQSWRMEVGVVWGGVSLMYICIERWSMCGGSVA